MDSSEANAIMLQGLFKGGALQDPYFNFLHDLHLWQMERDQRVQTIRQRNPLIGGLLGGRKAEAKMVPVPNRVDYLTPELLEFAGVDPNMVKTGVDVS